VNRDGLFLADIVKACDKIANFIASGHQAFLADEMIQDAVIRNLEIIGEASKNLSPQVRAQATDQPWRQITGMRDKLIHHYFGVKLNLVWKTASEVVPPFRTVVAKLLSDLGEETNS
jgi:uncharacterized protein with HEPN domain